MSVLRLYSIRSSTRLFTILSGYMIIKKSKFVKSGYAIIVLLKNCCSSSGVFRGSFPADEDSGIHIVDTCYMYNLFHKYKFHSHTRRLCCVFCLLHYHSDRLTSLRTQGRIQAFFVCLIFSSAYPQNALFLQIFWKGIPESPILSNVYPPPTPVSLSGYGPVTGVTLIGALLGEGQRNHINLQRMYFNFRSGY